LLQAPYGHEGAGWGPVLAGVGCAQCGCALCATYRAADVSGVGEVTGAWWRFGFAELISRGRSWRRLGSPRCAGFESLGVFWRAASYQRVAWGDRVALRFLFSSRNGTLRSMDYVYNASSIVLYSNCLDKGSRVLLGSWDTRLVCLLLCDS
jgi:hypothetical protein